MAESTGMSPDKTGRRLRESVDLGEDGDEVLHLRRVEWAAQPGNVDLRKLVLSHDRHHRKVFAPLPARLSRGA